MYLRSGGPQKILGEPRGAPNDTPGRGAPVPGAARAQRPVRHWCVTPLRSNAVADDGDVEDEKKSNYSFAS